MGASWSALFEGRRDVERRFGRIFDLPVVSRVREVFDPPLVERPDVLDVGAGDRRVERLLRAAGDVTAYTSVDPDPEGAHDFSSLQEIEPGRAFDLVVALEVAEHIPPDDLPAWFEMLTSRVGPGGCLVLSTPNTWHPQEYLRDATHRTPLAYDQLGAMIEGNGLRLRSIHRVHPDPFLRRVLRRFVFGWLFRLLSLDYARRIVVVADRPGT